MADRRWAIRISPNTDMCVAIVVVYSCMTIVEHFYGINFVTIYFEDLQFLQRKGRVEKQIFLLVFGFILQTDFGWLFKQLGLKTYANMICIDLIFGHSSSSKYTR